MEGRTKIIIALGVLILGILAYFLLKGDEKSILGKRGLFGGGSSVRYSQSGGSNNTYNTNVNNNQVENFNTSSSNIVNKNNLVKRNSNGQLNYSANSAFNIDESVNINKINKKGATLGFAQSSPKNAEGVEGLNIPGFSPNTLSSGKKAPSNSKACLFIFAEIIQNKEKILSLPIENQEFYILQKLRQIPKFGGTNSDFQKTLVDSILKDLKEGKKIDSNAYCQKIENGSIGLNYSQCIKAVDEIIKNNITTFEGVKKVLIKYIPGFSSILTSGQQKEIINSIIKGVAENTLSREKICSLIQSLMLESLQGNDLYNLCVKILNELSDSLGSSISEFAIKEALKKIPGFSSLTATQQKEVITAIIEDKNKNGIINAEIHCLTIVGYIMDNIMGSDIYEKCIAVLEKIAKSENPYTEADLYQELFEIPGFILLDDNIKQDVLTAVFAAVQDLSIKSPEKRKQLCIIITAYILDAIANSPDYQQCLSIISRIVTGNANTEANRTEILKKLAEIKGFSLFADTEKNKIVDDIIKIKEKPYEPQIAKICAKLITDIAGLMINSEIFKQCIKVIDAIASQSPPLTKEQILEELKAKIEGFKLIEVEKQKEIAKEIADDIAIGIIERTKYSICFKITKEIVPIYNQINKEPEIFQCKSAINDIFTKAKNQDKAYILSILQKILSPTFFASQGNQKAEEIMKMNPNFNLNIEIHQFCSSLINAPENFAILPQCNKAIFNIITGKNSLESTYSITQFNTGTRQQVDSIIIPKIIDLKATLAPNSSEVIAPINTAIKAKMSSYCQELRGCPTTSSCSQDVQNKAINYIKQIEMFGKMSTSQDVEVMDKYNQVINTVKQYISNTNISCKPQSSLFILPTFTDLLSYSQNALNFYYNKYQIRDIKISFDGTDGEEKYKIFITESTKICAINFTGESSNGGTGGNNGGTSGGGSGNNGGTSGGGSGNNGGTSGGGSGNKDDINSPNTSSSTSNNLPGNNQSGNGGQQFQREPETRGQCAVLTTKILAEYVDFQRNLSTGLPLKESDKIIQINESLADGEYYIPEKYLSAVETYIHKDFNLILSGIEPSENKYTRHPALIEIALYSFFYGKEDEGLSPSKELENKIHNSLEASCLEARRCVLSDCPSSQSYYEKTKSSLLQFIAQNGNPTLSSTQMSEIDKNLGSYFTNGCRKGLIQTPMPDFKPFSQYIANILIKTDFNNSLSNANSSLQSIMPRRVKANFLSRLFRDRDFIREIKRGEEVSLDYITEIGKCTRVDKDIEYWYDVSAEMKKAINGEYTPFINMAMNRSANPREEIMALPIYKSTFATVKDALSTADSNLAIAKFISIPYFKSALSDNRKEDFQKRFMVLYTTCDGKCDAATQDLTYILVTELIPASENFRAQNPGSLAQIAKCDLVDGKVPVAFNKNEIEFVQLDRSVQDIITRNARSLLRNFEASAKEQRKEIVSRIWGATASLNSWEKPIPVAQCEQIIDDVWTNYTEDNITEFFTDSLSELQDALLELENGSIGKDFTLPPSNKCKCYTEKIYKTLHNLTIDNYSACNQVSGSSLTERLMTTIGTNVSKYILFKEAELEATAVNGRKNKSICLTLFKGIQNIVTDVGEVSKFLANQETYSMNAVTLKQICVQQLRDIYNTLLAFKEDYFTNEDTYSVTTNCDALSDQ